MDAEKERFIELLAAHEAIRFGRFQLKSGRESPYFVNAGTLRTGSALAALGRAYAAKTLEAGLLSDFVFGPAYKGVPLAVATAIALAERGRDAGYCFDRKEAKDHGEGGVFVGTEPEAGMHAVIVDDVITSGASIRHAVEILRKRSVAISGVVVAVDRQEKGRGSKTTLEELEETFGFPVLPIVTVREIVDHLHRKRALDDARRAAIEEYLARYGPAVSGSS